MSVQNPETLDVVCDECDKRVAMECTEFNSLFGVTTETLEANGWIRKDVRHIYCSDDCEARAVSGY